MRRRSQTRKTCLYFRQKWSILSRFFQGRTALNLKCHFSMIERRKKKQTLPQEVVHNRTVSEPEEVPIFDENEYQFFDAFDYNM